MVPHAGGGASLKGRIARGGDGGGHVSRSHTSEMSFSRQPRVYRMCPEREANGDSITTSVRAGRDEGPERKSEGAWRSKSETVIGR